MIFVDLVGRLSVLGFCPLRTTNNIFFFEKAGDLPIYIDKKNNKRFKSIQ
jgi:hypothetical protein